MLEFQDAEQAKLWRESAAYAEARAIHHVITICNIILVHGASCLPEHPPEEETAM